MAKKLTRKEKSLINKAAFRAKSTKRKAAFRAKATKRKVGKDSTSHKRTANKSASGWKITTREDEEEYYPTGEFYADAVNHSLNAHFKNIGPYSSAYMARFAALAQIAECPL